MNLSSKHKAAVLLINEAYKGDKSQVSVGGEVFPREYLYAQRMVDMLLQFKPDALEEHLLAARCQHIYRWEVPRSDYPMNRKGYHQWRSFLYTYQSKKMAELLLKANYSSETINFIKDMVEKKNLKKDANAQLIEDVVCLVFLQYYVNDFVEKHKGDLPKLNRIIKSTWNKMSERGQEKALSIDFIPEVKNLVLAAVGI